MKKDEIKVVFFGTPEFSAYILEQLIEFCRNLNVHLGGVNTNFEIQAVVTRPDKAIGRHKDLQQSPVALVAQKHDIPTLKPTKLDEDFIKNHLSLLKSDLFVVASYGKIIPKTLLDIPKLGALNVHGSILPKYRGASPIQTALLNGDKSTGVTIMLMDEQMDHGPILSTKQIAILEQDNYQTLSNKMMQVGAYLLTDTLLKFIQNQITPKPQNHAKATFTKIIKKETGYFEIDSPPSPEVLDRMIRAYYPWPGVWTIWRVKSRESRVEEKVIKLLLRGLIQMEGKKPISLKDFQNGYPNFPLKNLVIH